jgi:hypothetical protein
MVGRSALLATDNFDRRWAVETLDVAQPVASLDNGAENEGIAKGIPSGSLKKRRSQSPRCLAKPASAATRWRR